MELVVTIVHVTVALFMILVVLVQGGNQGGVGAAFGGGNTQGVFGAGGATTFLGKLTYGAAMIFMVTSISLTILQGKGGDVGLSDKLRQHSASEGAKPEAANTATPAPEQAATEEVAPAADEAGKQDAATPAADSLAPGAASEESPAAGE